MAHKIAFIGAGSFGFTRSLVRDLLSFPAFNDAEIALMDINAERLDSITRAVKRIVEAGNYPAKVVSTMDRAEALKGAKGVVTTILHGDVDVWQHDILIPKKYGVDTNVGDTRGPSGIFRYLRTVNPILDIAADIERYCPDAVYLNYTNPMAMLCRAVQGKFPKHRHQRSVPQRAGHREHAGQVDRRAGKRNRVHLRGHQPSGVLHPVPVAMARTRIR